jgi:hypothetical protein
MGGMNRKFSAHLDLTKTYWKNHLQPKDVVIDATCGNGYDTLFLAQMPQLALFSIDIQQKAIENTQKILEKHQLAHRVSLHCKSHESFDDLDLPSAPHLIIYNLGYLPGGNKNLTTRTETSLASLDAAIAILNSRGALSITCYPGHPEGEKEHRAILLWAASLCPKTWTICYHRWVNRPLSPTVFWIQRAA